MRDKVSSLHLDQASFLYVVVLLSEHSQAKTELIVCTILFIHI